MTACLIAGCKVGGVTKDDFLDKYGAAGQYVTYYANGGNFNDKATRTTMNVYYRPDQYIICSEQSDFKVARKFFNFDAWYYIETDDNGDPVYDEEGGFIFGDKVVPEHTVGGGKHISVAANWIPVIAVDVYLITDDGQPVTDSKTSTTYNSGDMYRTFNFGTGDNTMSLNQNRAIEATDATYLHFFEDEACTVPITHTYLTDSDNGEEDKEGGTNSAEVENIKVYAKYLRGNWNIVSSGSDVVDMLKQTSSVKDYYLFSTDGSGVIDCNNAYTAGLSDGTFNINIQGNGVTIKNLKVAKLDEGGTELSLTARRHSFLGTIAATAQIKDVTFENLSVVASADSRNQLFITVYLVAHGVEDGAKIEGLAFKNATLSVTVEGRAVMENTANWLYSGITEQQVTISGASLILNGNTIAEIQ